MECTCHRSGCRRQRGVDGGCAARSVAVNRQWCTQPMTPHTAPLAPSSIFRSEWTDCGCRCRMWAILGQTHRESETVGHFQASQQRAWSMVSNVANRSCSVCAARSPASSACRMLEHFEHRCICSVGLEVDGRGSVLHSQVKLFPYSIYTLHDGGGITNSTHRFIPGICQASDRTDVQKWSMGWRSSVDQWGSVSRVIPLQDCAILSLSRTKLRCLRPPCASSFDWIIRWFDILITFCWIKFAKTSTNCLCCCM